MVMIFFLLVSIVFHFYRPPTNLREGRLLFSQVSVMLFRVSGWVCLDPGPYLGVRGYVQGGWVYQWVAGIQGDVYQREEGVGGYVYARPTWDLGYPPPAVLTTMAGKQVALILLAGFLVLSCDYFINIFYTF